MSNVKLAIRVRPFFERELKSETDRVTVVNVIDDNTVTITNVKVNASGAGDSRERVRSYHTDYTLDSSCASCDPRYASQDKVFETIGRDVVATVSGGRSACVLAYGQSATGKTHTMMGSEGQPGLVPRLCRALAEEDGFAVTVSFLEIYNERVHDLLAGEESVCHSLPRRRGNARKDLRVREHPGRGTYVQNLRRVLVHSGSALLALVREGSARRRTAPTRRNSASSRSHALLSLTTLSATLHLADLAGSEKASWEGCGGGRQKEGANINKSLVALSNVISALVVSRCGAPRFVPYRDSALTWLLKDCFSGGARAFIIATVSPSVACYGESASTLRWAARARQLPASRAPRAPLPLRAALQDQLNRLLAELANHHIRYVPETGKILYDDNHWNLPIKNLKIKSENFDTDKNTMNPLSVKTDNHTSESTASSVASGSSDVINTLDKRQSTNLSNIISHEMDKLFGPSLERTTSGTDLKSVAPLKVQRRQYRSQEVLPDDKTLYTHPSIHAVESIKSNTSHIQIQNNREIIEKERNKNSPQVSILYDNNQRAEIVASVTERLYSKLKKKEESAVAKMESMVDKKIMEPLSELRICTNARQRLVDLSQKALRNKRRIGIPAHSQTRKLATRVRDQGIDVQTDLQPYYIKERDSYTLHQDVGTETVTLTPRCKEIAVGPKCGSVTYSDTSTTTGAVVQFKNCFVMTDDLIKNDQCTQTIMIPFPPPRRRKSTFSKYLKSDVRRKSTLPDRSMSPIININISQACPADSESQSDDSIKPVPSTSGLKPVITTMTPDLLTNHNGIEINDNIEAKKMTSTIPTRHFVPENIENNSANSQNHERQYQSMTNLHKNIDDEFPDGDYSLPRVRLNSLAITDPKKMEDMILSRNVNAYPYNLVLSPLRERENVKRTVKFREIDATTPSSTAHSQTSVDNKTSIKHKISSSYSSSDKDICSCKSDTINYLSISDSTDSSKTDSDAFIWKKVPTFQQNLTTNLPGQAHYSPVYKHNMTQYRTSKAKLYKEFLGLDSKIYKLEKHIEYDSAEENEKAKQTFNLKRQFFETKFEKEYPDSFHRLERNILNSCDRMESSVNKYEKYLNSYHQKNKIFREPLQTPREYLQHLVRIRRQIVKDDSDHVDTSSSTDASQRTFYGY